MDKVFIVISQILNEPVENITDESSPETLENWDSFNGVLLFHALEKEFKIKFNINDILAINSVADLKKQLKNKGIIL